MHPSSLLLFALMALPSPSGQQTSDAATAGLPALVLPHAVEETAQRVDALSGFALQDALDDIGVANDTWGALSPAMQAVASSPYADRKLEVLLRDPALYPTVPAGSDPRLMRRMVDVFIGLAELFPSDVPFAELFEDAPLDAFGDLVRGQLADTSTPVAIRKLHRKSVRGLVALLLLSTKCTRANPAHYDELLAIAAEGAENLVLLASLSHEDTANADRVVRGLGLPPLDRKQLQQRTYDLEQARTQLASTAQDLDGVPLRLPPDPGLRDDET